MSVCVLGSINMDTVAFVDELPLPGETVTATRLAFSPGGKGANQAVASARLGAATSMLGMVGDDGFGKELLSTLRRAEVEISDTAIQAGETTGQAWINVSRKGENTIVVIPGANHQFTADDVDSRVMTGKRVFLSQYEMPLEAIKVFFQSDVARSGLKILNAAPAVPDGEALFCLVDIVVVNETELASYANEASSECLQTLSAQARKLLSSPGQWFIITLGAKGALAVSLDKQIIVEGLSAKVIDATGAGDCFCGALAVAFSENMALNDALEFANRAAAIAVTRMGAAPSMPTRSELEGPSIG